MEVSGTRLQTGESISNCETEVIVAMALQVYWGCLFSGPDSLSIRFGVQDSDRVR
ncbi:hypothetical protein D3C78_1815310 [compost metagenome]